MTDDELYNTFRRSNPHIEGDPGKVFGTLKSCGYPVVKVYRAVEGELRAVLVFGDELVRFRIPEDSIKANGMCDLVYMP